MTSAYLRYMFAAGVLACASPAFGQYQPYPPHYQPAPMQAPASQAAVVNLDNRIGALERQISQLVRQLEESGNRVTVLEAELARLRNEQQARVAAVEPQSAEPAPAAAQAPILRTASAATKLSGTGPGSSGAAETDPAEIAYDEGYQLWKSGKYDQAITALRAMASSFPDHRRVSWANNLTGRALLDKGEARAAAEALLANYRKNPKGERAADSLYYLGQALMKLGQASQACKAYAELEEVYGASMRGELKTLLPKAKSEAKCG